MSTSYGSSIRRLSTTLLLLPPVFWWSWGRWISTSICNRRPPPPKGRGPCRIAARDKASTARETAGSSLNSFKITFHVRYGHVVCVMCEPRSRVWDGDGPRCVWDSAASGSHSRCRRQFEFAESSVRTRPSRLSAGLVAEEIFFWWRQMLIALKVVHDHGIVHCDLKPQNFILFRQRSRDHLEGGDTRGIFFQAESNIEKWRKLKKIALAKISAQFSAFFNFWKNFMGAPNWTKIRDYTKFEIQKLRTSLIAIPMFPKIWISEIGNILEIRW